MSNKYIVPIGVLIGAILIIVGGYMILSPHSHYDSSSTDNDNINDNESHIEPTQKIIPDIKVQEGELKKTADLKLKIGNKYRYEYRLEFPLNLTMNIGESNETEKEKIPNINMKVSGSADIVVNRKERYNKSDAFVLKYTSTQKYENFDEFMAAMTKGERMTQEKMQQQMQYMNMLKEGVNVSGETWINNDGKTVKAITKMFGMEVTTEGENAERGSMMGGINPSIMIQSWMLALNENFEWTRNMTANMNGLESTSSERYKVVGIEKIDTKAGKKKCYKVEVEGVSSMNKDTEKSSNKKFSGKTILWIDYNERILTKMESWIENLKIVSIELVDEKI